MKPTRIQLLSLGLSILALGLAGCQSEQTTSPGSTTVASKTEPTTTTSPSTTSTPSENPSAPATDSSTAKPAEGATASEAKPTAQPSAPTTAKADTAAPPKSPPDSSGRVTPMKVKDQVQEAKPDMPEGAKPPVQKDNDEKELMTSKERNPRTEKPVPPKVDPREKEEPAKLVPKSGNPAKYVGVYQMDDPKLEGINKKLAEKKKPPILFQIEIKPDGTFEFKQGTSKKFKLITGTVQASPETVVLSPYKVDGEVAIARGDKAVFNFAMSKDGKKLLTIAKTASGKTNLNFKKIK